MAEEIAIALVESLGGDFVAAEAVGWAGSALTALGYASVIYYNHEQQRRQQAAARNAYEQSLKDRYVMVRSTTAPRSVVLGRQRVSGPIAFISSYGTNREHLVFCVVLAAHQIDAVESIYFDDEQVTLDGGGNVLAVNRRDLFTLAATSGTFTLTSACNPSTLTAFVDYGTTRVTLTPSVAGDGVTVTVTGGTGGATGTLTLKYQPAQSPYTNTPLTNATATVALDGSGAGSVTLPHTPSSWGVVVTMGSGEAVAQWDVTGSSSLSGATVTIAAGGAYAGQAAVVTYAYASQVSYARVRSYLGGSGQAADAAMVSNLPGVWDSAHTGTGLAYLVVELDYSTDAFPNGLPNVSAVVRGALCYDPRTTTTVWTQNPALLMRHVATHPLLGRLSTAQVDDVSISAAANVCDTSTAYVQNGQTYTRPLYQAGTVANSGGRAKDTLDELALAMAGRWAFVGGVLKVKAGSYVTPLQTLDDTWLSGADAVQVQAATARADLINDVSGRFVDEQRDYVETTYPRVTSSTYITADGVDLPLDQPLNAVSFAAQCQQVVACKMRDVRMGMTLTVRCNMRAWAVELFDTVYVTLSRFGWVNKPFEVTSTGWTPDGGISLALKATDPSIWALGTSFSAPAVAPNTLFPSPFQVPAITSLAVASGAAQSLIQNDGVISSRMQVTFATITDQLVLAGGGVQVRYGRVDTSEDTWTTEVAPNGQSKVYITGLRDGWVYMVKARAFNALVNGAWCNPVRHTYVDGTSQIVTAGLAPNAATDILTTYVAGPVTFSSGT